MDHPWSVIHVFNKLVDVDNGSAFVNLDETCVCGRVCVCVCHHHQSEHRSCPRHGNASRVNFIDFDFHSRSHSLNHENNKCLIFFSSETDQAIPIHVCCEDSLTKGLDNLLSV